jgi:hypothetical protein
VGALPAGRWKIYDDVHQRESMPSLGVGMTVARGTIEPSTPVISMRGNNESWILAGVTI